jgi:hypothetical protein
MYDSIYQDALEKINRAFEDGQIMAAESAVKDCFAKDDGSVEFLQLVKIPLLHMVGYFHYRQAKRYLRDAYILSNQYPGTTPALEGNIREEISAFVRQFLRVEVT